MRRASLFTIFKRTLAKHAMAEEDVVYPMLHRQGQDPEGSNELYHEHANMKILLFELEERLMANEDWSQSVRALRDLIQSHIEEEEGAVFPKLRTMLDQSEASKMSGQICREEALVL